jgi:hypothetical protein
LRSRKMGRLPHEPAPEEQRAFVREQLEPRLQQAKKGSGRAVVECWGSRWCSCRAIRRT